MGSTCFAEAQNGDQGLAFDFGSDASTMFGTKPRTYALRNQAYADAFVAATATSVRAGSAPSKRRENNGGSGSASPSCSRWRL